jgi:hypothetical protein
MPDTGGDVLCPTCGQWTPPAPFCSECGATLQVGIREPGDGAGGAFRRGHEVDQPGSPWGAAGERFEPEPEDEAARAAAAAAGAAGAAGAARVDHLAESDADAEPPWPPTDSSAAAPPPADSSTEIAEPGTPTPGRRSRAKAAAAAAAGAAAAGAAAATPPPPPAPESAAPVPAAPVEPPPAFAEPPPPAAPPPVTYAGPPRDGGDDSSGVSGLVFVVFLGIGVLALLGGAILGGVFDGPVAEASPTPSIAVSTPTPEPLPSLTPDPSGLPSTPGASPTPAVTPPPAADGFLARAEPCAEPPSSPSCDNSGAENNGDVWILVSFRHAQPTDTISVTIHDESGTTVAQSNPITLAFCGTNTDCAGWTFFDFHNLDDGDYEARVTRNGSQVATTEFTVD